MKADEINRQEFILRSLIHKSILNSVSRVVKKCDSLHTKPQEPDFIASLTLYFTPELFNGLKILFPRTKFSVTGVYCHQKPLAKLATGGKSPEIGDILFVYVYTDERGKRKFNSLLLQAKISRSATPTIAGSDEHQLKLYSEWPDFTYLRAGRLNGTLRSILPKTINDGAQYLLIDTDPVFGLSGIKGTFPMGCATPAKNLSLDKDLASELIDFVKFKSGRAFEEDPDATEDHWTKMIWELLNAARGKTSKRKNIGEYDFPRLVTEKFNGCYFQSSELNSILGNLLNIPGDGDFVKNPNFQSDEEEGAPSVIVIESNDNNES